MPDPEEIAEQIVDAIEDARAEGASDIIETMQEIETQSRIAAVEEKLEAVEESAPELPIEAPAHGHPEITERLDDIAGQLASLAASTADVAEAAADAIEDVAEPVTEPVTEAVTDTVETVEQAPRRGHVLFRNLFGNR